MTKARVDVYIMSAVHNAIRKARFLGIIVELGPDFQLITLRLEIVRFVLREYDHTNVALEQFTGSKISSKALAYLVKQLLREDIVTD